MLRLGDNVPFRLVRNVPLTLRPPRRSWIGKDSNEREGIEAGGGDGAGGEGDLTPAGCGDHAGRELSPNEARVGSVSPRKGAQGLPAWEPGQRSNRARAARLRAGAGAGPGEVRRRRRRAVWTDVSGRASRDGMTASRGILKRCAAGCWRRGCGVGARSGGPIGGGGCARRTAANWFSWMGIFTPGSKTAGRELSADPGRRCHGPRAGRFSAQETIWAAVAVLRRLDRAALAIPQTLYTDWKTVYVRAAECRRTRGRRRTVDAVRSDVRDA